MNHLLETRNIPTVQIINLNNNKIINKYLMYHMGIGDWGLGIGDWGLGIGPNPQSPIPNPQSPIPNPQKALIGI